MIRFTIERMRRGMTQKEVARVAGVNPSSLSRIERGREPAFPKRGQRLADAIEWTGDVDELFKEVD